MVERVKGVVIMTNSSVQSRVKVRVRERHGITLCTDREDIPVSIKYDGTYLYNPWDFDFRYALCLYQGCNVNQAIEAATVSCCCVV